MKFKEVKTVKEVIAWDVLPVRELSLQELDYNC